MGCTQFFFSFLLCVPASCLNESDCNDVPQLTRSPKAATTLLCFPYTFKKVCQSFPNSKTNTYICILYTCFRIRVSAREFKVELQVFKTSTVTLIDGLYVNLTLHLSMHFGKIQKFPLKKQRKATKHSRFSVNWIL